VTTAPAHPDPDFGSAADANPAAVLAFHTDAVARIARGEPLPDVLALMASFVEAGRSGVWCTVLMVDEADGGRLYTVAAPGLPATYAEAIDGTLIGPHAGACGRAAATGLDVMTENIATDPDWVAWRDVALQHGLHACWSVPIMSTARDDESGKVLATFATYFDTPRRPTDDERRDIARVTTLATLALERHHNDAELRRANLRDALTGLANRRLFLDELGAALRRARRRRSDVTVLFLDIDHFKVFNDSMGHLVGDEVLRIVASRVQLAVRAHDLVARFGGDEFTFLFEDLESERAAVLIVERLIGTAGLPIGLDGGEASIAVSIGIAIATDPATEPDDLIRDADMAMYRAKAQGGSRFAVFDQA